MFRKYAVALIFFVATAFSASAGQLAETITKVNAISEMDGPTKERVLLSLIDSAMDTEAIGWGKIDDEDITKATEVMLSMGKYNVAITQRLIAKVVGEMFFQSYVWKSEGAMRHMAYALNNLWIIPTNMLVSFCQEVESRSSMRAILLGTRMLGNPDAGQRLSAFIEDILQE